MKNEKKNRSMFAWHIGKIILIEYHSTWHCIIRWLSEGGVEYDMWYSDESMFENLMSTGVKFSFSILYMYMYQVKKDKDGAETDILSI